MTTTHRITRSTLHRAALATALAAPLFAAPLAAMAQTTAPAATTGASTTTGNPAFATSDMQTRASKVIGSSVYNDQKQKIGTINDLLIANGHDVGNAVISVGGFLGIASKLIEVPYGQIHMQDNRLVMPGASKDQLKQMPEYKYKTSNS